LNRTLGGDMRGMFITILYAVIDAERGEVIVARAGHELPLFLRRDPVTEVPVAEFIGSEGMPLGMVPDQIFSSVIADRTVPFDSGDILVLYTDGLTEAPNEENKEFSNARLADALRALQSRSVKELNDGIMETVQRFAGTATLRDDLTLVTIKRT
jgi:sigma-B regulation protein RsbU (phosphoserine phosphatase)